MGLECDVCSQQIEKLELGLFSWKEEEGKASNFHIHHKHTCDLEENNNWVPLYLLTNPKILCNWFVLFIRKWRDGMDIKESRKLEKSFIRLFPFIIRELEDKEKRDWIGYTNRVLPMKFPGED